MIALARTVLIEHERAGDVLVFRDFSRHLHLTAVTGVLPWNEFFAT
jgi:hypothetical protein